MFKLRLIFTGLCAYVPSKEIRPYEPPYEIHVLLVNAVDDSRGFFRPLGVNPERLNNHFPVFRFNVRNVIKEEVGSIGQGSGVWLLAQEEVYIDCEKSGSGVNIILDRVPPDQEEPDPDDPGQERDFKWVPDLDKVLPGAGYIDSSLIHPAQTEDEPYKVGAVVHLREGILSSYSVAKAEQVNQYIVSQFFPPPKTDQKPVRQVLAFEVALEVPELAEPVTIRSQKFGEDSTLRSVTLGPAENENVVEVKIMNLCSPDVILDMIGGPIISSEDPMPRVDEDFRWFYILAPDEYIGERWTPIPAPVKFPIEKSDTGGGAPAICTGCVTKPPVQEVEK